MGTRHNLRMAFILGSLFMVLLIILYWDDIGGFNLYPLQDSRYESPPNDLHLQIMTGPSGTLSTSNAQKSIPTTASTKTLVSEDDGGTVEAQEEDGVLAAKDLVVEQESRKKMITDVCSGNDNLEFPGRTRTFEQIPNRELDHLIVDDTHQIIYCYVPKVACTNWKRVMVVLSQSLISPSGKPYTDPETVPADLVHNSSLHLTFAKFWRHYGSMSRHLMAVKLQHYTKFLFVRDPFVRLISAFRNKFGRCVFIRKQVCDCACSLRLNISSPYSIKQHSSCSCLDKILYLYSCERSRPNEDFYRQFGSEILQRYGNASGSLPETAAEAFSAGIKPTFQQFITYLLDPETERERIFNEHWRQVWSTAGASHTRLQIRTFGLYRKSRRKPIKS
ncbi:hypothetical protein fugu_008000 [Takifugu bimaculatus]|uniref:Carbohydrate sulfotransferase n=1 Tax=Takifugu bimaculatus TaxID=433685 RepID=A0A4Z2B1P4_9TELE|nr:hypothetical protein fugu_008000 [Takifugu bimaculatus]